MLPSRKSLSFSIHFYWHFSKSWSQIQKVGVKYSIFGVNESSAEGSSHKDTDQHAQPCSLISSLVIHYLDSKMIVLHVHVLFSHAEAHNYSFPQVMCLVVDCA